MATIDYALLAKFLRSLRPDIVQDDPGENPLARRRSRCDAGHHGGNDSDDDSSDD